MQQKPASGRSPSPTRPILLLVLLWLIGNALRLTVLAVPPLIPLIHDSLDLTGTQVGILTALPSVLLAVAAVPGSLVIARLGVRHALVIALAATAVGGALRGILPHVAWLYGMTIAMSAGIAIMQVAMPSAVRAWLPERVAFATATYSNGMLIGEVFPVALTLSLLVPLFGGSWEWALAFWSGPVAAIAILMLALAPAENDDAVSTRRRWWPDWRDLLIWRLGFMLGTVNAMYFTSNAFIPDFLRAHGEGEWISAALTGLNAGQLPASFLLLAFASRLQLKAWPIVGCGALCAVGAAAFVFGSAAVIVAGASLLGFAAAAILVLVLALPPLLAAPDDEHRVTAAMFTISYSCSVVVPVLSGALWDATGVPGLAFAPVAIAGLLLMLLAPAINHVPRAGD